MRKKRKETKAKGKKQKQAMQKQKPTSCPNCKLGGADEIEFELIFEIDLN